MGVVAVTESRPVNIERAIVQAELMRSDLNRFLRDARYAVEREGQKAEEVFLSSAPWRAGETP